MDFSIVLTGYTHPEGEHWRLWRRFKQVFENLGISTSWTEMDLLQPTSQDRRIFFCWDNPNARTLVEGGLVRKGDIIFQELSAWGTVPPEIPTGEDLGRFLRNWSWPVYQQIEELLEDGIEIYGFGSKTNPDLFPEKNRIYRRLSGRIFELPWGSSLYSLDELRKTQPITSNFQHQIGLFQLPDADGWGNRERLKSYIENLLNGYDIARVSPEMDDKSTREMLSSSALCPIITPAVWAAEESVRDNFWSIFAAGRFGVVDSAGVYEYFDQNEVVCATSVEEYLDQSRFYLENPEKQKPFIENVLKRIQGEYNFQESWKQILDQIDQKWSTPGVSLLEQTEIEKPIYCFVPSNDTHVDFMAPIARRLEKSSFLVISEVQERADDFLTRLGFSYDVYKPGNLAQSHYDVMVFGNDWGARELQVINEAKSLGIPTVILQEGCLDFDDPVYRRLLSADYAFLQGPGMLPYVHPEKPFVTGNPKYDTILEEPLPAKPKVMINCNFTYGIFEEVRDEWVDGVVAACRECELDFFISQHPRDKGKFPPDYPIVHSDAFAMRDQLSQSSVLISRFSTVIYEALWMGRRVIYYNPHHETFRLFLEDQSGAFPVATNPRELADQLRNVLSYPEEQFEKSRVTFLEQHCNTMDRRSSERCANRLFWIAHKHLDPKVRLTSIMTYADRQFGLGKLREASTAFQNAVQMDPDNFDLRLTYANLCLYTNELHEARLAFQHCLGWDPENIAVLTGLATVWLKIGNYPTAHQFAERAAWLRPLDPAVLLTVGYVELTDGNVEEGRVQIYRALEIDPRLLTGYQILIEHLLSIGEYDEARRWLEKAREYCPEPASQEALAILFKSGKSGGGKDTLDEILFEVSRLIERKNIQRAIASLREALIRFPDHMEVLLLYGELQEKNGNIEEALTAYSRVSVRLPDRPEGFYHLANLYLSLGHGEIAKAFALTAQTLDPSGVESLKIMAREAIQRQSEDEAAEYYMETLKRSPDDIEAGTYFQSRAEVPDDIQGWVLQAEEETAQENWRRAMELYSQARCFLPAQHPLYQKIQISMTVIQEKLDIEEAQARREARLQEKILLAGHQIERNNFAGAKEILEEILTDAPDLLPVKLALGNVQLKLGMVLEAQSVFEEIVQTDPHFLDGYQNLVGLYVLRGQAEAALDCLNRGLAENPGNEALNALFQAVLTRKDDIQGKPDTKHYPVMVSVIVPTHNRPQLLKDTLRSILKQTFEDFEIVLINDGGMDVQSVVQELNDPRIRYFSNEENLGPAETRNVGIRVSRGKYIAYLDDDDLFYPEHLETLVGFLENSVYRVAYTNACCCYQEIRKGHLVTVRQEVVYNEDVEKEKILVDNQLPILSLIHERSCLDEIGYFDPVLRRHEDWELWIRMFLATPFYHIPLVTAEYMTRGAGENTRTSFPGEFLRTTQKIHLKYRQGLNSDDPILNAQLERREAMYKECIHYLGATEPEIIRETVKPELIAELVEGSLSLGDIQGKQRIAEIIQKLVDLFPDVIDYQKSLDQLIQPES